MEIENEILNWRTVDESLSLSGQPNERQFETLAASGVSHVINLGLHEHKDALEDQTRTCRKFGLAYAYIPVDFENPTEEDFAKFVSAIDELKGMRVHVHCIYNARVTAFVYRMAKERGEPSPVIAFDLMESIWRPGGVWAKFIGKPSDVSLPNRYAGYDYVL